VVVLSRCAQWKAAQASCHRFVAVVCLSLLAMSSGVQGREALPASAVVELASLPAEARQTHRLIHQGGPFPYAKDGIVFGNRERLLPKARRGFYREYTVPTPGSRDRGARRIVCGGQVPQRPDICYYTQDHYASFRRIAP
jgi:ribonuclease T1